MFVLMSVGFSRLVNVWIDFDNILYTGSCMTRNVLKSVIDRRTLETRRSLVSFDS